jgi:hypothetical protein
VAKTKAPPAITCTMEWLSCLMACRHMDRRKWFLNTHKAQAPYYGHEGACTTLLALLVVAATERASLWSAKAGHCGPPIIQGEGVMTTSDAESVGYTLSNRWDQGSKLARLQVG